MVPAITRSTGHNTFLDSKLFSTSGKVRPPTAERDTTKEMRQKQIKSEDITHTPNYTINNMIIMKDGTKK